MNRRGVVLVMVFMVMTAVVVITVAFLFMTSTRSRGTAFDVAGHKALWIGEAGLQDVMYRLANDAAYRSSPTTVNASLGDGSYSVTVGKAGDTYTLESTGTVDVVERQISLTAVMNDTFTHAICSGGNINTNSATNLTITGTQKDSATDLPTVDFSYYQTNASPGQDISGNYTFTAGTYSGIWHITGNVTIESNVTINGTVATTKKITASRESNITVNPTSPNAALLANDAIDFSRSDTITIDSLIYSGADGSGAFNLSRSDTVDITGTIVAGGNVDLSRSNDVTITYDSSIINDPPPGISGAGVIPQRDWDEI